MPVLSRDQILKPDVAPTLELVPVPEWGEGASVYVGVISGRQRDRLEAVFQATASGKPKESFRALLVAYAIRDEANRPLFAETDLPALGDLSSVALDRVFKAATRINKMSGEEDVEAEGKKCETETS